MNPTEMVPVCKVALPLMGRSCHWKNFRDAWANVFSAKSCREIKSKFPLPRLCTCFPLQKKLTDPSSDENLWFKIPIPALIRTMVWARGVLFTITPEKASAFPISTACGKLKGLPTRKRMRSRWSSRSSNRGVRVDGMYFQQHKQRQSNCGDHVWSRLTASVQSLFHGFRY